MAKIAKPRKTAPSTYIIYTVIIVILLILCLIIGAAMDYAITDNKKVDFLLINKGLNIVTRNPDLILKAIRTKGSYSIKILFIGALSIGIFILYKYTEDKKRLHRKGTEYGSAEWGNEKEMKALADKETKPKFQPLLTSDKKRVFDENGDFIGAIIDNNILISKETYLSLNSRQHMLNLNILIIGGSGSGKTRFFAKPNILQLNTSYVITDPKGEILQSTGKVLTEAGYEVRVFNLIEMEHSNNYNPFHYVFDYNGDLSEDNIKKMVNVLFKSTKGEGEKDDFWSQKGQSLLEAIVYLLFDESEYNAKYDNETGKIISETRDLSHLNFFSVTEKMRKLRYPPSSSKKPDGYFLEKNGGETEEAFNERRNQAFLCPLDKDFIELEKRKPDALAIRLYKEIRNAPEETGQSFLSSANVKTFMFNMLHLMNLTCCDNIELEKLGDRKTALFIIISATDSTYNFLAAMMYTQLFDTLANRANFKYGGTLKTHVRCIMDEFSNIGQIPDFDKVIAFVRSMGISINIIIQNLAQLKARYEKTWEVITGNCDSFIFLGGQEETTLKYICEKLGKETIDIRGHNRTLGKQKSTSENNSIIGRELMQPNEIATMPISDCLVMIRSHNPFYCTKYQIEKHPNYKFTDDYSSINKFNVSTIKSKTIEDIQPKEKVDTYINNSVKAKETFAPNEKVVNIFKKEEVDYKVTATPIEFDNSEISDSIDEILENATNSEEYADGSVKYGDVSDFDAFDLGEPDENGKEMLEHDEATEEKAEIISIKNDEAVELHYDNVDNEKATIDNVSDAFDEAVTNTTEIFPDSFNEIQNEDDYGFTEM